MRVSNRGSLRSRSKIIFLLERHLWVYCKELSYMLTDETTYEKARGLFKTIMSQKS